MDEGGREPWEGPSAVHDVFRWHKHQATEPGRMSLGVTSAMASETDLGRSVGVGTISPWSRQRWVNNAIWKRAA